MIIYLYYCILILLFLIQERSLTNNGAEAVNSALRRETGARSHPQAVQKRPPAAARRGIYGRVVPGHHQRGQRRPDPGQVQ